MPNIEYLSFEQVEPQELMDPLNEDSLRAHLIQHPYFDTISIQAWIKDKIETDTIRGCRVRVVLIDGLIAGWCGIQPDNDSYELALVISKDFWGRGITIFKTLMQWASELGHKEVLFHLLETRREYKALAKMASKVQTSELLGRSFTTYHFLVAQTDNSNTQQ